MTARPSPDAFDRALELMPKAPTEGEQRANEAAARIASREARAHWVRTGCERTKAALDAWERNERSWPWPDPTPEETARADAEIAALAKGHRHFTRTFG